MASPLAQEIEELPALPAPRLVPTAVEGVSVFDFEGAYSLDDMGEAQDLARLVSAALTRLSEREQLVLRLRFFEDMTRAEIGEEMGISGGRVGQIEAKALRRLKHPALAKGLRDYAGDRIERARPSPPVAEPMVWIPPHDVPVEVTVADMEPFHSFEQITAENTVMVRFGNGVWRSVHPERIIVGEPVCDRWNTRAVVAFWCDGQPMGERWEDVRKSVKRKVIEYRHVAGHWSRRAAVH